MKSKLLLCGIALGVITVSVAPAHAFSGDEGVLFEGTSVPGEIIQFRADAQFDFHPVQILDPALIKFTMVDPTLRPAGRYSLFTLPITYSSNEVHGTYGEFDIFVDVLNPDPTTSTPTTPVQWELAALGFILPACNTNPIGDPCREVASTLLITKIDPVNGNITKSIGYRSNEVPGPVPIIGVAAFFGYSRKLRKRIKNSKTPEVMRAIC